MRQRNLKSAQRQFISCLCTSGESVKDFVYIDGVMVGNKHVVRKVDCFDIDKMPAIGVIVRKPSDNECIVQTSGLNSLFSGLVPGKTYKVHNDKIDMLRPEPGASGYSLVQFIGTAFGNNELMLSIDCDFKKAVV